MSDVLVVIQEWMMFIACVVSVEDSLVFLERDVSVAIPEMMILSTRVLNVKTS